MQTTFLMSLGLLATGVFAEPVANPDAEITGTPQPSQSPAIASALSDLEFNLGLGAADEVASVTKAIAAAPSGLRNEIEQALPNKATENYSAFQSAVNDIITGSPTGFGALPTDVQGFVKSVATQEASIFNDGGAQPTGNGAAKDGPGMINWTGGIVAGLMGIAAML